MIPRTTECWAILERRINVLDGDRQWLHGIPDGTTGTQLFRTRADARAYVKAVSRGLAKRPDLRAEPHGWRMPRAVRVVVEVRVLGGAA